MFLGFFIKNFSRLFCLLFIRRIILLAILLCRSAKNRFNSVLKNFLYFFLIHFHHSDFSSSYSFDNHSITTNHINSIWCKIINFSGFFKRIPTTSINSIPPTFSKSFVSIQEPTFTLPPDASAFYRLIKQQNPLITVYLTIYIL